MCIFNRPYFYIFTQAEIARTLGLHYATVSRLITAAESGTSKYKV